MHVDWLDLDSFDRRDVDAATAVLEAARALDAPHELAYTAEWVRGYFTHGWDGNPTRLALARDTGGRTVGVLALTWSAYDNFHAADVDVVVDPSARRRGIGRQLFAAGTERVRADGRTLVTAASWDDGPGMAFAKAMGLDRALEEVKRVQDLWDLDRERLADLAREAAAHHQDYEIVALGYPTPPALLTAVADMTAAINDAPLDDLAVEDEVFTPARVVAHEQAQAARGRRRYRLIARHRASGALAGQTVVHVPEAQPWHGLQADTSVVRAHRGHRVGLALKLEMLRRLTEQEPQLRVLETWNAASNSHMIGVNEALGYRVVARQIDWQKHL